MTTACLQVPAHFRTHAQPVHVVASESAPQTFAAGRRVPVVPRGSSALAIKVRPSSPSRLDGVNLHGYQCKHIMSSTPESSWDHASHRMTLCESQYAELL